MIKIKKNIAVSETGFLFDSHTGESFNLNKTGQIIFKLLVEEKDPAEILNIISEKYDIETNMFHRYMDEFMMMLKQYNLTEKEED
jgi:hypothetical protein